MTEDRDDKKPVFDRGWAALIWLSSALILYHLFEGGFS